jgi:glutathione synthase/RimK-type ligase-like ATP-grasp enzyme
MRGHHQAILRGEQYLEHLAAFNRSVINDQRTFNIDFSKVEQYRLLKRLGLNYPPTVFGSDTDQVLSNSAALSFPLLTKHNRSALAYGIRKFDGYKELESYLHSESFVPSPDGILLLQEYIRPKNDRIVRIELIDGELVYAYEVSTAHGLQAASGDASESLFSYLPDFQHPLIAKYRELAATAGFDIVSIEYVEAVNGIVYSFDINGTPNYPAAIEAASGNAARRAFQEMIRSRLH